MFFFAFSFGPEWSTRRSYTKIRDKRIGRQHTEIYNPVSIIEHVHFAAEWRTWNPFIFASGAHSNIREDLFPLNSVPLSLSAVPGNTKRDIVAALFQTVNILNLADCVASWLKGKENMMENELQAQNWHYWSRVYSHGWTWFWTFDFCTLAMWENFSRFVYLVISEICLRVHNFYDNCEKNFHTTLAKGSCLHP